ncbi:MAG: ribosome small subunit-dependent GTPase A [Bacteroidetes bacterium]|nr:ribosome small subunit-dependent GTPase A [Bacteroidota bacterium]MBS1539883.1 ribosome small subunit-dependent GTPase A [Bacteroidota bacterium]
MKGVVTKSTGSWYVVRCQGETYECRLRGKIRLEGIKETNPVAVGDYVAIEMDEGSNVITEILPRKNHILRQSVKKTGHSNILAANIDQAVLVATVQQPRTSLGFIDRFLVSAEAFRIPQVLIFNKQDLLTDDQMAMLHEWKKKYEAVGISVYILSALQGNGLNEIKNILSNKISLVAGHSGVGKSTLLNQISDSIRQSTQQISAATEKGTHTTTFAEMFWIDDNTAVIDTPGVKEWGLVDMSAQEISDYFPEMRERRLLCKFGSKCLHLHEPGCAIIKAVEEGAIWFSRYENLINMTTGSDNRK